MRTLRDPLTIAAIVFSTLSAFADASAAKSQTDAEAGFLQVQAQQERVARGSANPDCVRGPVDVKRVGGFASPRRSNSPAECERSARQNAASQRGRG